MKRFTKAFLIAILSSACMEPVLCEPFERNDGYVQDSERYADLMEDPYKARILDVFLDPGTYNPGLIRPSEEEMREMAWYRDQAERMLPLLLEVLKREEGNLGGQRMSNAISRARVSPGDKSAIVEEVRRQLPEWQDRNFLIGIYNNLVTSAFSLLAREGDRSDIVLMQSLLDPERQIYQDEIDKYTRELSARLAREEIRPQKRAGADGGGTTAGGAETAANGPAIVTGHANPRLPRWIQILGGGVFLGVVFVVLRILLKRRAAADRKESGIQ